MKTKKQTQPVEAKPELTPEQKKEQAFNYVLKTIRLEIDGANAAMADMLTRFQKRGVGMFESLDAYAVEQWVGQYFLMIQEAYEIETQKAGLDFSLGTDAPAACLLRILQLVSKDLTRSLVRNFDAPNGSGFYNASMIAKKEAQSRVVEKLGFHIHALEGGN